MEISWDSPKEESSVSSLKDWGETMPYFLLHSVCIFVLVMVMMIGAMGSNGVSR